MITCTKGIGMYDITRQQVSSCNQQNKTDSDTVTLTEQNMLSQVGYQLSSEGFTGDIPGVGH